MMFKKDFVVAIKVSGKVLREDGELVRVPFGSEYSILLKNLKQTQKAVVGITIDGKSVTENRLIVNPNSSVDLERPVSNDEGFKFKFIERTSSIESYRGIKAEDGLVVIDFQFEREIPVQTYRPGVYYRKRFLDDGFSNPIERGASYNDFDVSCSLYNGSVKAVNNVGITGSGSSSDQSFTYGSVRILEPEIHRIIFRLVGDVDKPVLVDSKKICDLCGQVYSSDAMFCKFDGNRLRLL